MPPTMTMEPEITQEQHLEIDYLTCKLIVVGSLRRMADKLEEHALPDATPSERAESDAVLLRNIVMKSAMFHDIMRNFAARHRGQ